MSGDRCYITIYPLKSLRHRTPRVAMIVSICIWIGQFREKQYKIYAWFLLLQLTRSSSCPRLLRPVHPHFDVPAHRGGLLVRSQTVLHGRDFPRKHTRGLSSSNQFIAAYLLPVLTISFCYTLMVKRVGQPTVEPVGQQLPGKGLLCAYLLELRIRLRGSDSEPIKSFSLSGGTCPFFLFCFWCRRVCDIKAKHPSAAIVHCFIYLIHVDSAGSGRWKENSTNPNKLMVSI